MCVQKKCGDDAPINCKIIIHDFVKEIHPVTFDDFKQ